MIKLIPLMILVLVASGCAMKMTSYSPSILMEGQGRVTVSDFKYLPSDDGKLKSNQVDTGMGLNPLYSENEIKDYVSDAVSKELKFIGYRLDPEASLSISGNIVEYSMDYIGLRNVDAKVSIEFIVTGLADGKRQELYRKNQEGFYTASKWTSTEFTLMMNEALRNCIKSFVSDAQAKKIL